MNLRRLLVVILTTLIALPAAVFGASTAQADLYRYWSFWERESGSWVFVETDPAAVVPADGSVNGWRFGAGGIDGATTRAPRTTASFTEICGDQLSPAGLKQVAVIIDTGTTDDAPSGTTPPEPFAVCATVPTDNNAVQVLQEVADTRVDGGLVCAVAGFPEVGCGEIVSDITTVPSDTPTEFALPTEPTPADANASENSASPIPTALIAVTAVTAVAVIIAIAGVLIARNRRS